MTELSHTIWVIKILSSVMFRKLENCSRQDRYIQPHEHRG